MGNKINIAELLKDCPRGMELDCVSFNNVTFECVSDEGIWIKYIDLESKSRIIHLTPHGEIELNHIKTVCVIFPKGKTTWEEFVPPGGFKDGNIVATTDGSWVGITEGGKNHSFIPMYCVIKRGGRFEAYFDKKVKWHFDRFATEEEKQKLFDAIKAKGYKWNTETKTLEKLIEPKFHEGQWIADGHVGGQITSIEDNYSCYKIADFMGGNISIPFALQDNYHLWTIQDAKDGDVLAAYECLVLFKKLDGLNIKCYCTYHFINNLSFYVDTLQNKDAFHPATEEEKQKLFDAIKANGYRWNTETKTLEKLPKFKVGDKVKEKDVNYTHIVTITEIDGEYYGCVNEDGQYSNIFIEAQDRWELAPDKFNINTLVPFESRVLVRDTDHYEWEGAVFGRYDGNSFFTIGGVDWKYCIPYEGNEHLFGTTNDCDDFFKTWEE